MSEKEIFEALKNCDPKPVPSSSRKELWAAVIICTVILVLFMGVLLEWI